MVQNYKFWSEMGLFGLEISSYEDFFCQKWPETYFGPKWVYLAKNGQK